MKKASKQQAKLNNIKKAMRSKEAAAETKRVTNALIDYRIKHGVKDKYGKKVFLTSDDEKRKSERLAWLENQRVAALTTPKEEIVIPTVEERMEKIDVKSLSVEDLMLAKESFRNERIKELNKRIY